MGVRSGGVSAKRERNQRQGLLIRPRPNAVRPVHTHRVAQAVGQKRHQHGVLLRELDAEGADGLDDDNLKLVGDFVHKVLNLPHEAVDAGLGARLRKGVQGRRLNVGGGVTGQTWGRMCPQGRRMAMFVLRRCCLPSSLPTEHTLRRVVMARVATLRLLSLMSSSRSRRQTLSAPGCVSETLLRVRTAANRSLRNRGEANEGTCERQVK